MTKPNFASFDYWKTRYEKDDIGLSTPLQEGKLTRKTTFLWSRETAPLPCAVEVKMWEWAPGPKAIAGYLRYIVLPKFFSVANGTDAAEEGDGPAAVLETREDLLARMSAEEVDSDDVKFLVRLLDSLDAALALDEALVVPALKVIADEWNTRFAYTEGLDHEIVVCASPEEVGQTATDNVIQWEVAEGDEGDSEDDTEEIYGYGRKDWLDLCGQALADKGKGAAFLSALQEEMNS